MNPFPHLCYFHALSYHICRAATRPNASFQLHPLISHLSLNIFLYTEPCPSSCIPPADEAEERSQEKKRDSKLEVQNWCLHHISYPRPPRMATPQTPLFPPLLIPFTLNISHLSFSTWIEINKELFSLREKASWVTYSSVRQNKVGVIMTAVGYYMTARWKKY